MSSLSSSSTFNTSSSTKTWHVNKKLTRQWITNANTQSRRWNRLLAAICSMALQQWGTKSFKASAGWHWKENDHLTRFRVTISCGFLWVELRTLTLAAARHMSATIRPATWVSNMFVVAKLKTFSIATCKNINLQSQVDMEILFLKTPWHHF